MPVILDIDKAPTMDLPHGRGRMWRLFDPSNVARNLDIHINVLNPGVTAGAIHYHKVIENAYVILEGEGQILDMNGKKYDIRAGQAIFFQPGELVDTHEIYNTGKNQLKLVEVYAPPHPKEAYVGTSIDLSRRDHIVVKRTE
jgi:mannose-6-phosphate isomerase-like protein (cupin superfamily)